MPDGRSFPGERANLDSDTRPKGPVAKGTRGKNARSCYLFAGGLDLANRPFGYCPSLVLDFFAFSLDLSFLDFLPSDSSVSEV